MAEQTDKNRETEQAIEHLQAALDVDADAEMEYHIRQALQLLGIGD